MTPTATRVDLPELPALAVGTVHHTRYTPIRHSFTYAHYQWIVDVDDLPRPAWPTSLLARFDPRDHLDGGRLGGGIRGDLRRWLAGRGVALDDADQVLMLAHARVLGHTFDPLSVFWVVRPDRSLKALVLEVHNTYGERHAYLLDSSDSANSSVAKAFYVSPFNDVSGEYDVAVSLSADRVRVRIDLSRDGERVLTAVTSAHLRSATSRRLASVALRHVFMTHRVSLLIRWHGVRLWRHLPVQPRPRHSEEAVR